jgi:hypothetical protein
MAPLPFGFWAISGGLAPAYFDSLTSASSLPAYGEIGSSNGGTSAYYFAFTTAYTNTFFYSADGNSWSSTPNPPSYLNGKLLAYAGYPIHATVAGQDVYVTGANDNSSTGHYAMWYNGTDPSTSNANAGNITYSTGGIFYGHRKYVSHQGTVVSTVWKFTNTLYCHRLQSATGGGGFTLTIQNANGGYPQYDPYGQYKPQAASHFNYISPNTWYWNRVYGGSTSANASVVTSTVTLDFNPGSHTYMRLANGVKCLVATTFAHNAGYVYSGGIDPADGWSTSSPKLQSPTGGNLNRPLVLDDNQTCVFFTNSGDDIWVTTDLVTFTLYSGVGAKSSNASQIATIKRTGTQKYILWNSNANEQLAEDTL